MSEYSPQALVELGLLAGTLMMSADALELWSTDIFSLSPEGGELNARLCGLAKEIKAVSDRLSDLSEGFAGGMSTPNAHTVHICERCFDRRRDRVFGGAE